MSFRKNKSHGNTGGHASNTAHGSPKERNQRQMQPSSNYVQDATKSQAISLLNLILNDDDDSLFSRRVSNAIQLQTMLVDSRKTISNSLLFRQEQMKLLDISIHDEGLRRVIEFSKTPAKLKTTLIKIISGLACYTRLDLALSWIFHGLLLWSELSQQDVGKERQWKKWLLKLLKQVLIDSVAGDYTKRQILDMSPVILANAIQFLDTMDSTEYLPAVIDVIVLFSENFQDTFQQRFRDVLDLLVDWNIDLNISELDRNAVVSCYPRFEFFWSKQLPFAAELLNHFLTDMQSIVQELTSFNAMRADEQNKKWVSCFNLLSCFQAIAHSILPLISQATNYHEKTFLDISLDKLLPGALILCTNALQASPDLLWFDKSIEVLLLLASQKPNTSREYQYRIYIYLGEKTKSSITANPQKYLETLMRFLVIWENDIDEKVVLDLIDCSSSPLFSIYTKNHDNSKLDTSIIVLLRSLVRQRVSSESLAHVNNQYIHRLFIDHKIIKSNFKVKLSDRLFRRTTYLIEQNNGAVLPALLENELDNEDEQNQHTSILTIRNALFFYYVLLDMAAVWHSLRFENTMISLRTLMVAWESKCNNLFVSCFQLLKDYWTRLNFMLDDEYGFEIVSNLTIDMLDNWTELDLSSRKALCELIEALLTASYESKSVLLNTNEVFKDIISYVLHAEGAERNCDSKEALLKLVTYYCQTFGSADITDLILERVQQSINDPHQQLQNASKDLLASLNPFIVSEINKFEDSTSTSIQNIIMATPHTGSFRPVHYEIVMKHLGMSSHLLGPDDRTGSMSVDLDNSSEWARRLLHHCDTIGNMKSVSLLSELKEEMDLSNIVEFIDNSKPLLCYWVIWESARYCMLSRLRTPFGGPQQTFAAFERMLSSLVSNTEAKESNRDSVHLLTLLLLLLDRLELQISNASDGSATNSLPAVPRPSVVFFRTNKKTCHDYFSRIRPNIIAGAKIICDDPLLIANATKMFSDLELNMPSLVDPIPWFRELNKCLCDLVEACIRGKFMDLIYGMQSRYKKLIKKVCQSSSDFKEKWCFEGLVGPLPRNGEAEKTVITWFQVAAFFASGRDELAIKSLASLRQALPNDEFGIITMLDLQALQFYTCLEDYKEIQKTLGLNPTCVDEYICSNLLSFNASNKSINNHSNAVAELNTFVKNSSLESCLDLARLDTFRNSLISSYSDDTLIQKSISANITTQLEEHMLTVLKNDIFKNISSLLELQLLHSSRNDLLASAMDWLKVSSVNAPSYHHFPPETKQWARLSACFERLYVPDQTKIKPDIRYVWGFIQLHTAKAARRQGNVTFAESLISKAVTVEDIKYLALYERAKLFFTQSDYAQAMEVINDVLVHVTSTPGYEELESKTYLKVARYLKNSPENEVGDLLQKFNPGLLKVEATDLQSSVEKSIDYALEKSIENNTADGRPWFEYATHYYKQGWRILDEIVRPRSSMSIVSWAINKIQLVLQNTESDFDAKQDQKSVLELWAKHSASLGSNRIVDNSAFAVNLRLAVPFINEEEEKEILETLDVLQKTVIQKFYASTQAYFRYLSLDIHNHNFESDSKASSTSMVTTATLRLLRILTKYGEALETVYTQQTELVCANLWKRVIPQLFAQLNNPNDFVRCIISKLISRICDEYPKEIVYDVIVCSTSAKTNRDTKQSLSAIANRMMDRNELLWVSTRRMAEELEKITVLLEERWLNKIASLQFDVMQQFSKLDKEIERLEKSKDMEMLQREKIFTEIYENIMKPTIYSVDKLLAETAEDSTTATPHETWFQKTYGRQLMYACNLLQKPNAMKEYRRGWELFQQLHRQLMSETHKVRILELSQVSPYLFSMKNTPIGIPGYHDNESSCFIDSFGSTVIVLPTKTKPKKLDMMGTDSKKYSYLFKGLEDLHLDERIMQLLTTTNGLLGENGATAWRGMRARTYAVIPLSDHSGMIQWVNDATPLFALFKKWQKREYGTYMLLNNEKPDEAYMHRLLQRPTENFTAKVTSALKAAGLRVTANRKYWPKDVLKKVYLELLKETPGDLLEKEIYYSSSSSTEWFKKSTSFARSLAVTSIIGYIIGLGDRHLDNMMVDFKSGEIIHIDYNVCFEKGKRLRVPELVPYRLTQNLYGALGITGVDGQFKTAAEETLRVLRKHKEVLITLLDAFVYDPLVDWESEAVEAGYRQMMELQTNLALVATRITEKQTEQEKELKAILGSLAGVEHNLQQWQESMLLETESLNGDEGSDEDDQSQVSDAPMSPTKVESSAFMGCLPVYLLREVRSQLLSVTTLINSFRSPGEGISPLLESIIIIETDADHELRPAQKCSKIALDAIASMSLESTKLDKQIDEKLSYESDWSYPQLIDFIQLMNKNVRDFYSSLRTLEEFGPENNKSVSNTAVFTTEKTEEDIPTEEVTNEDELDEEERPHKLVLSQEIQQAKSFSNSHVSKIMKRIRSKLEGIDFGVQHRMNVPEQVARTIEQATSVDNLCLMYEGWTSWV